MTEEGELVRTGFNEQLLKCLYKCKAEPIIAEAHDGECREHQSGLRLYQHILKRGFYSSTIEANSAAFTRKYAKCQVHARRIHAPTIEIHQLTTPWPFHTWAMDLVGPIPKSNNNRWILAATKYFTEWVEAALLTQATGEKVREFILQNIIHRFGVPMRILTDNGTPFVHKMVKRLTEKYLIDHVKSTPYYPQGNGQAEVTNKTLISILSKMVTEKGSKWSEKLPKALWAYRTSERSATNATPYSLVLGGEAVSPMELKGSSLRVQSKAALEDSTRMTELEVIDERRDKADMVRDAYQKKVAKVYDRMVRCKELQIGDMVLKAAKHIMRKMAAPKFSQKWEGPFIIHQIAESGYVNLINPKTENLTGNLNVKWVKKYYM